MILFPAIDLKDGQCVRLEQGDMDRATVFNTDPADQARRFAAAGCRWLHVVDLNGAISGRPVNDAAVEAILKAVQIPVQLGGGIRTMLMVRHWLELGVARVVLGTAAMRDPDLVLAACRMFPGRVVVSIDARGGKVAVSGWAEQSDMAAIDLAKRFADAGVAAILHTDIDRDGLMQGPNLEATRDLARAARIPVIASGGISGAHDLRALKALEGDGVVGAVSGRALYDGRLDLAEALAILDGDQTAEARC